MTAPARPDQAVHRRDAGDRDGRGADPRPAARPRFLPGSRWARWALLALVVFWNGAYKGVRVVNTLYALELGATPLHTGLLLATYGVFPLLLAVPAGRIADRYGSRIPIIRSPVEFK